MLAKELYLVHARCLSMAIAYKETQTVAWSIAQCGDTLFIGFSQGWVFHDARSQKS